MDVEKLIAFIFKRGPLWDQRDRNHSNIYVLRSLWKEVAGEMELSEETVRAKWKGLRDKYRKVLQGVPKKRSGDAGGTGLVTWQYYRSLHFLDDVMNPRHSAGNFDEEKIPRDQLLEVTVEETENEGYTLDESTGELLAENRESEELLETEIHEDEVVFINAQPSTSGGKRKGDEIPEGSRKKQNAAVEAFLSTHREIMDFLKRRTEKPADEVQAFLCGIGSAVRSLSIRNRLKFQKRVLEVLEEHLDMEERS